MAVCSLAGGYQQPCLYSDLPGMDACATPSQGWRHPGTISERRQTMITHITLTPHMYIRYHSIEGYSSRSNHAEMFSVLHTDDQHLHTIHNVSPPPPQVKLPTPLCISVTTDHCPTIISVLQSPSLISRSVPLLTLLEVPNQIIFIGTTPLLIRTPDLHMVKTTCLDRQETPLQS